MRRAVDAVEAIKQAQRADAQRETDGTRVRTWSVVDTALHGAATRSALAQRVSQLHGVILRELSLPARVTRSAQQTQRLLKLLVRLGTEYIQQARSLFFNSQNLEIKGALQHQRFEGDIGAYVGKISKALFSALRRAVEKYQELFAPEVDPDVAAQEDQSTAFSMTSSLVVWVVQRQLGDFCALLRRHIALTSDIQVVSECMGAAFEHCADLESHGFQLSPQVRSQSQHDLQSGCADDEGIVTAATAHGAGCRCEHRVVPLHDVRATVCRHPAGELDSRAIHTEWLCAGTCERGRRVRR